VQTSDFRLTIDGRPPEETAQKQVVLNYRNWTRLLCYTGIAQWFGHDTAQWLTRILTHGPDEQRSPREIADVLVNEGGWLRRVRADRRRHTFTLALFASKLPWVCMISNYQRAGQNDLPQPLDHFIVTCHRPRPSRLYPTGWTNAVDDDDRRELLEQPSSERDPLGLDDRRPMSADAVQESLRTSSVRTALSRTSYRMGPGRCRCSATRRRSLSRP
jgi:hypothetical protein